MLRTLANWLLGKTTGSLPPQSANSPVDPLAIRLCERCENPQKIHITLMNNKDLQSQVHLCEECARRFLEQPPEKEKSKEVGPDVDCRDTVYYAELRIARNSETFKIELRPSDALAVCLKADAPFLISERVLAEVQTS
jgi:hypothetical protein